MPLRTCLFCPCAVVPSCRRDHYRRGCRFVHATGFILKFLGNRAALGLRDSIVIEHVINLSVPRCY